MNTTHDYLNSDPRFTSQILSFVEQYPYPGCLELRWDAPACGVVTEDTGIVLKAGSRFLVLSRLSNQLRYYAASEDVSEIDYEVGICPDASCACQFAEDYLVHKRELPAILIPRKVLSARQKGQENGVIEQSSADMRGWHPSQT